MPFPSRMISCTLCFLAWKISCFSSFTNVDRGKPLVSGVSGPTQAVDSQMVSDTYMALEPWSRVGVVF